MLLKTEGFVLKNKKYGEADSLLSLFTRKAGKISAIAKGGRKPKSTLLAGIQPFCYSDFVLYRGKSLYTVNQCEVIEIFYPIREDLKKLTYCSYLIELVDAVITEGQTNNRLFNLLGKTLYLFKKDDIEIDTIVRAFELKFMYYSGFKPHLSSCVNCNHEETGQQWRFSPQQGGLLCKNCYHTDLYAMKISEPALRLANYLLNKDITQIQKLKVNDFLNEELKNVLKKYISVHINKYDFKSLDIADKL